MRRTRGSKGLKDPSKPTLRTWVSQLSEARLVHNACVLVFARQPHCVDSLWFRSEDEQYVKVIDCYVIPGRQFMI